MRSFFLILTSLLFLSEARSQNYFAIKERSEQKQNKIVYWEFGYIEFEKTYAKQKVATKYGFHFELVAGCAIVQQLRRQIARHNKKISKILTKKIGTDWLDKVYDETNSVYTIDTTLIYRSYKYMPATFDKLAAETKEPYEFRVYETTDPGVYHMKAMVTDEDRNLTGRSLLVVEATYPGMTFKVIEGQNCTTTFPSQ